MPLTAIATVRKRYLSGIEVTYRSSRKCPRIQLRKAEYLSSISSDVNAPGAASSPSIAPAPSSSSDDASSCPPRTIFVRKWPTSRPNGRRAQRRIGLRAHGSNNVRRNRVRIHLLRHPHEALFQSHSAEARVHLLHGPRPRDSAVFQHREMRAQPIHLLQYRRRKQHRL